MEAPALRPRLGVPLTAPTAAVGTPGAGVPAAPPKLALVPNAVLAEREDLTPDVARLVVRPDGGVRSFEPGQYFSLGLTLGGRPVLRPYSTASRRGATDALEFLVRRVATGSFTPSLWQLTVGERLWIGPPKGLFRLERADSRTHLLVSAGTGIAPFISMIPELVGDEGATGPEPRPRVVVAHGVSYESELAYRPWLESLTGEHAALVYAPTVSRPDAPENSGWSGRVGRVERILPSLWAELGLAASDTVAYLCGNPDMVESSRRLLLELGMPAGAIIHENYWAAPAGAAPAR